MSSTRQHWNRIFATIDDTELGWYEADGSQTRKFLDLIPLGRPATLFLPGAGTSALVDELLARGHRLILNDISDQALARLAERIGENSRAIWLHHDITQPLPPGLPPVDIWIDRAVLHFLTEETAIDAYFANLRSAVRPGGHVLMAEFSSTGALQCAGLTLHRYSLAEMTERMGSGFDLVAHEEYTFINPSGEPRPYLYTLCRRGDSKGARQAS